MNSKEIHDLKNKLMSSHALADHICSSSAEERDEETVCILAKQSAASIDELLKALLPVTWQPIETAPKNKYIMLRGDSGMLTYPKFYVVGKLDLSYRDDWIDINNDRLTDSGYVPEEWMEIPE